MHYPKILENKKCTSKRLREIFTARALKPLENPTKKEREEWDSQNDKLCANEKIRRRFERRFRSRILDGLEQNCRSARGIQAVDMAWDSPSITKESIPLMLWAMGKIKKEALYDTLKKEISNPQTVNQFFTTRKVDGVDVIDDVNRPRICEVSIDLVRSYITRRHAALDAGWSNYWPLYDFQPRGVSPVTQLRGDALTQRVDMISDGFNYRHADSQYRRDMLKYGRSIIFPRSSWDVKTGWRPKATNTSVPSNEIESYVEREGIDFVNPNPGRVYYDSSSPLANINTNTGPTWIGYWDIMRFGELADCENSYYNLKEVFASSTYFGILDQFSSYFDYYYEACRVAPMEMPDRIDPTISNDRSIQAGRYSADRRDQGVLVTQHFEKINPLKEGIGDYDNDVWVRFVVAGDCTVIGAEFMPSIPACHGAINWDDNRQANQSMGMALLSYQDQAGNIMSHMLQQIRASLLQIWVIDKDLLDEPIRKAIEANAANANWWVDPRVLTISRSEKGEAGMGDPRQAFTIIQNQMTNVVQSGLAALGQLLNLADRLLILSPNELGQPIQRESSAREVQEIASSVQSIYSFINQGPREQIAAKKEMLYESLICKGTAQFRVPITAKYTVATIRSAGFDIDLPDAEQLEDDDIIDVDTPVLGSLHNLTYDYVFNSRDGAERSSNVQGAQVVMQLLQSLLQIPGVPQKMGTKAIYDMVNLVIRMSGAPTNFQLQTADGADEEMPAPGAAPEGQTPAPTAPPQAQQAQQPQPAPGGGAVEALAAQVQRQGQLLDTLMKALGQGQPAGPAPQQSLAPPQAAAA